MTRLSILVGIGAVAVTGLYAAARWFDLRGEIRYRVSLRLDQKAERPKVDPLNLKSMFSDVPTIAVGEQKNHTHGDSAGNRSSGSITAETIARSIGSDVWFYQCSASDRRKGRDGCRTYYWTKDINGPASRFEPQGEQTVIVMVDVDHYVDMNDFLARNYYPVILYNCQPSQVARCEGEYSYTFHKGNELHYSVSGGGDYQHQIWNYRGDSVKVTWGLWGLPVVTTVYQLERRFMGVDHQLILLAPLARYWFREAILANVVLDGRKLERYDVVRGEFTRMQIKSQGLMSVSTGRVGEYAVSVVSAAQDDTIASVARTQKSGLGLPAVRKVMDDDQQGVEVLFEYHKKMNPKKLLPTVNIVDDYVRSFTWYDDDYDPDAKPSMVSFMAPLIDGAFCPTKCKSNEQRAIDKRILEQRNDSVLNDHHVKIVEEFCARLWGADAGKLDPKDEDYLKMKQAKPTQRRILDDAEYEKADRSVKSFMKCEAYESINDPRIISTINGVDKRDYSVFTYTVGERLKEHEWYGFGKTPKEIAERVATVCEHAKSVVNTDFSRMDGRVSQVLRYLETRVMMTGFRSCYHKQLTDLLRSQHSLRGKTTFGVRYDTGLARLSGSPETSVFNTIANAFTTFAAYRSMTNGTSWIGPDEAFLRLGVYGGDDGVSADVNPMKYISAAERVGQKLKLEPVKRGDLGVKFLSRQFGPYVWHGDPNSCCDYSRAMTKFHVTGGMNQNITPIDKLRDKAFALCLSDHDSYVIGPYVSRVIELAGNWKFENLNGTWLPQGTDTDVQYPNEADDWMSSLFHDQLGSFNCEEFLSWVNEAQKLEDLLHCPPCNPKIEAVLKKEGTVVVDDDLLSKLTISSPPVETTERSKDGKEKPSSGAPKKRKPTAPKGIKRGAKRTAPKTT